MNKKIILITAAVGLLGFLGAFATGWLTRPSAVIGAPPAEGEENDQAQLPNPKPTQRLTASPLAAEGDTSTRSMTEEQLKELIYEIRDKIDEYNTKLGNLEKEKERLAIAQQTLKKDVEALNNLRVELASTVVNLKNERDLLLKARVEIDQAEKNNFLAIAAAYDKMDPISASEILSNMAISPAQTGGVRSSNLDDAVKILHFMQERTKAKVLAEMVNKEPSLAALLCQKLKQVTEGK